MILFQHANCRTARQLTPLIACTALKTISCSAISPALLIFTIVSITHQLLCSRKLDSVLLTASPSRSRSEETEFSLQYLKRNAVPKHANHRRPQRDMGVENSQQAVESKCKHRVRDIFIGSRFLYSDYDIYFGYFHCLHNAKPKSRGKKQSGEPLAGYQSFHAIMKCLRFVVGFGSPRRSAACFWNFSRSRLLSAGLTVEKETRVRLHSLNLVPYPKTPHRQ